MSNGLTGAAAGAATLAASGLPPVSALSESLANAEFTRAGPVAIRLSSLPILVRAFFTLVNSCSLVNGLPTKSETPAWMAWITFSLSPRLVTMMNCRFFSAGC
ncbi:hypothetical protein D3C81_1701920 [compost metagenome]